MQTCCLRTACNARCFRAASPQRGSWRQPAQGKCSFPCDDWNRLKICGNHLLPARGFRQDATHRLDRCIVAPSFRGAAHGWRLWKQSWPFPACVLFLKIAVSGEHFFHKLLGAFLMEQQLQKQTDLLIRNGFRVGKVAFQHGGSGTKPVRPFLPG